MDNIVIIIIVLLVILIWVMYSKNAKSKRKLVRREEPAYRELVGYEPEGAERVIEEIEVKEHKDELDHYRLGEVKMFNLNQAEALDHYDQALQVILFGDININQNQNQNRNHARQVFVADRIRDNARIARNAPLEQKAHFVAVQLAQQPQDLNLVKTEWIADSQNVHDSTLNSEVKAQYMKLRDQNGPIDVAKNLDEIYKWIPTIKTAGVNKEKINDGLYDMNRGNNSFNLDGDNESTLLAHVWERIKHSNNQKELKEAFAQQLSDCKGVCLDGRISRVMSSFAKLDELDPNLGVFKTKEVYRHEMLDNMGVIVKRHIDQAPPEVQDDYKNNKKTDQVQQLEKEIKDQLNEKAEEYKGKLPEEQRTSLLNAALESV